MQKHIYLNKEDKTNGKVVPENDDIHENETSILSARNLFSSNKDFSIPRKGENNSEVSTDCNLADLMQLLKQEMCFPKLIK